MNGVAALIHFAQGATTDDAGRALIGVVSQPVVASNANDFQVRNWLWQLVDVGFGSALAIGTLSDGLTPTLTFTPDVPGCYLVRLVTEDSAGLLSEDYRVFGVLEASGRLVPSFRATDGSMNFAGHTFGWKPYVNAYLRAVDGFSGAAQDLVTTDVALGAAPSQVVPFDTTGGALTITMPDASFDGMTVIVVDAGLATSGVDTASFTDPNGYEIQDPDNPLSTVVTYVLTTPRNLTWVRVTSGGTTFWAST